MKELSTSLAGQEVCVVPVSVVRDINTSAAHLNNDLRAFQWKMSFNPDPSKQAQEFIFSCKHQKISHPSIYFNNNPVESISS